MGDTPPCVTRIEITLAGCYDTFWSYESLTRKSDLVTTDALYTSNHNTKLAVRGKITTDTDFPGTTTVF